MALSKEEKRVLANDIITYSEYQEAITGNIFDKEERDVIDEDTPEWFHKYQKKAMNLFRKKVPQVHLLPRSRRDYLDLRQDFWIEDDTNVVHTEPMNYQELFRDALANQIWFMHENEIVYENGWLNATTNFTIGSYSQGGQNPLDYRKVFNDLYPSAYDCLEEMGWLYGCVSRPLDAHIFYKGERN